MPMFPTPKPRQFRYQPRFYDPEKERWEALKQKYADERELRELEEQMEREAAEAKADTTETAAVADTGDDADLEYFRRRVREADERERGKQGKLTWRDMFRKREMPTFNYTPRFATSDAATTDDAKQGTGERINDFKKRNVKIRRRFDVADPDYMKPVPASRIMLYALLVCMLIYWIVF